MFFAFYYSWALTLVTLGFSPLMVIAGQYLAKSMQGFSESNDKNYKDSGSYVSDALTNFRTVVSFGN